MEVLMDDELIVLEPEDGDEKGFVSDEDFDSVFDIEDFDEETLENLIGEVQSSIDFLEDIVYNMYYSYNRLKEETTERINTLEIENKNYCEELKKLYQELANNKQE
jgi:hypothetical protein